MILPVRDVLSRIQSSLTWNKNKHYLFLTDFDIRGRGNSESSANTSSVMDWKIELYSSMREGENRIEEERKIYQEKEKTEDEKFICVKKNSGGSEISKVWKISQANFGRFLACGRGKKSLNDSSIHLFFLWSERDSWIIDLFRFQSGDLDGWEIYTINATFAESAECRTNTREKVKLNSGIKATFPPILTHSYEAFTRVGWLPPSVSRSDQTTKI